MLSRTYLCAATRTLTLRSSDPSLRFKEKKKSSIKLKNHKLKGVPVCFQGVGIQLTDDVEVRLIQPSKPRGDSANIPASSPLAMIGPEFIAAIGDLVVKCQRAHPSYISFGYRKLEKFSGNLPTPAGEETFEEWVEQALQAVEEWEVADTVKRQRLTESLRALAADVIRNLNRDKPGCTAAECLEALREIFGEVEDCAELSHRFFHTYQHEGEELSICVRRLDKFVNQIIQKKGMEPSHASRALWDQILKGALPLDPIMLKFQARVKAILEEEALIRAKKKACFACSIHCRRGSP
uniref:Paraneoplastic antigen Ma-like C-terminal domain-containing protein n=1 Tax=Leptobrachium leishanense TaxID=445787 RepID=A0A8C5LRX6_9ANUR